MTVNKSEQETDKTSVSILGWLLIVIIPIVFLLVCIEIALRIYLPQVNFLTQIIQPSQDSRSFLLKPNTTLTYEGLYQQHESIIWEVNQQGLRSDRLENKTSDKFRILTYGDSETYGWSVSISDTWQRQMEKIDPTIEVINFGIPAYNVENIADHMKHTLPDFDPDMVIYFYNKNDYYPAFSYNPILSRSYTYLVTRMVIYQLNKDKRKAKRISPKGAEFISKHVLKMIELCKSNQAPLYILVTHNKYTQPLKSIAKNNKETVYIIDAEKTVDKFPDIDNHLPAKAHHALANYICSAISQTNSGKCSPLTHLLP